MWRSFFVVYFVWLLLKNILMQIIVTYAQASALLFLLATCVANFNKSKKCVLKYCKVCNTTTRVCGSAELQNAFYFCLARVDTITTQHQNKHVEKSVHRNQKSNHTTAITHECKFGAKYVRTFYIFTKDLFGSAIPQFGPKVKLAAVPKGAGVKGIYFDFGATTPLDPRVLDAMLPFMTEMYGNPHSRTHEYGWNTSEEVEQARKDVAQVIGANEKDIVFTSGATESNNLAIKGVAHFYKDKKNHVITVATVCCCSK